MIELARPLDFTFSESFSVDDGHVIEVKINDITITKRGDSAASVRRGYCEIEWPTGMPRFDVLWKAIQTEERACASLNAAHLAVIVLCQGIVEAARDD